MQLTDKIFKGLYRRGVMLEQMKEPALSRTVKQMEPAEPCENPRDIDALSPEEILRAAEEADIVDETDGRPLAEKLREAGAEYGAKTGRPRRVGPIDLVATRYGVEVQGATNIALTKLDILSYMKEIPVCAAYEIDGEITHEFPFPAVLEKAKPVVKYLPGWGCDISGVRTWADMPQAARDYVEYVEQAIGCHIGYVSVGAERESLIIR